MMTEEQYEQLAIMIIKNYKNKDYTDAEIQELYSLAIPLIVINIKRSEKMDKNVASKSQGSRSVTYRNDEYNNIDSTIKSIIGLPYLRCY